MLTYKGLQVSDDKVEAIVQAPRPNNQSELRLSSVWCSIVQGSSQAKWKWGTAEENAFQAAKRRLTRAPVMPFFKQGAETRFTTDSSPVGIGAVLEQKREHGQYRSVHYASRKLTPHDIPRWRGKLWQSSGAVKSSSIFLYIHGNNFDICTNHKPLITVIGPHSKPPSARIESWMLYIQQFKYNIKNIPGRENTAGALSRLPVDVDFAVVGNPSKWVKCLLGH